MKTLIVLIGPTGVGKTELSLRLAGALPNLHRFRRLPATLCRFENRTAAPTPEQLQRVNITL